MHYIKFILPAALLFFQACSDPVYIPKPRSYPRVDFPQHQYSRLDADFCQFTFEYPVYTQIQQDTAFFGEIPPHSCWFDVYYPAFDGRIHFTYAPLNGNQEELNALTKDAFNMADWHNKRADYIDELVVRNPQGVSGVAFDIDGAVASPFQFFLTDSTHHYVRASLYFNTHVQADSMKPVIDFVREDMLHIIETFSWKND
ncbi:MAG: hypothetical protein R2795_15705 [Saprospiraceae bacterium]